LKKIFILITLLLILTPFNVDALALDRNEVLGSGEVTIGNEHSFGVFLNVDEVKKGSNGELGIWLVGYELEYDPEVIIITGFTSRQWDSILYEEDGKYYVLSEVNDTNYERNKCIDEVLYCATYSLSINYYVKNTDKTDTTIKVKNIEVGLLPLIENDVTYTEEDIVVVSSDTDHTVNLTIKKNTVEVPKEEPPTIIEENKPTTDKEINNKKEPEEEKEEEKKSSNKYLKSLTVENYNINFNKYKTDYEIIIPKNINKLNISAETEDEKATYKITGADNLSKSKYTINIEVTAENGSKMNYTITARIEENESTNNEEIEQTNTAKKEFVLEKKHIIIGSIIGGGIIFIIIISAIISFIRDRKIDKKLDEL